MWENLVLRGENETYFFEHFGDEDLECKTWYNDMCSVDISVRIRMYKAIWSSVGVSP